jgi:hypothetical protein
MTEKFIGGMSLHTKQIIQQDGYVLTRCSYATIRCREKAYG